VAGALKVLIQHNYEIHQGLNRHRFRNWDNIQHKKKLDIFEVGDGNAEGCGDKPALGSHDVK
jgi:hypothetical protein